MLYQLEGSLAFQQTLHTIGQPRALRLTESVKGHGSANSAEPGGSEERRENGILRIDARTFVALDPNLKHRVSRTLTRHVHTQDHFLFARRIDFRVSERRRARNRITIM